METDLLSGGREWPRWRPPRVLTWLVASVLVVGGIGYLAHRGSRGPAYVPEGRPAADDGAVDDPGVAAGDRIVLAAGREYVRYDDTGSSIVAVTDGVRDVLVTPSATVLLFAHRATVSRERDDGTVVLGPSDAVLPTYDRTAVLLVSGRGSSRGETVRRVELDNDPAPGAMRLAPGLRALAETPDGRLVVSGPTGTVSTWDPRSEATRRLATGVSVDSVGGNWLVTHGACAGLPCTYLLVSLDGTRRVAIQLPAATDALGAPVLSPDGKHLAVVAEIQAGDISPRVALAVASVARGGADARFVVGLPFGHGHGPGEVRPAWSADGTTVYVARPVSGEVVAYRLGWSRARLTRYLLPDATRVWV